MPTMMRNKFYINWNFICNGHCLPNWKHFPWVFSCYNKYVNSLAFLVATGASVTHSHTQFLYDRCTKSLAHPNPAQPNPGYTERKRVQLMWHSGPIIKIAKWCKCTLLGRVYIHIQTQTLILILIVILIVKVGSHTDICVSVGCMRRLSGGSVGFLSMPWNARGIICEQLRFVIAFNDFIFRNVQSTDSN